MSSRTIFPTLFVRPAAACPRCDDHRIIPLAVHPESSFRWFECEGCEYLWALPRRWSARDEVMYFSATGVEKLASTVAPSQIGCGYHDD